MVANLAWNAVSYLREHHEGSHSKLPGLLYLLQHMREAMPQAPRHGLDLHFEVLPVQRSGGGGIIGMVWEQQQLARSSAPEAQGNRFGLRSKKNAAFLWAIGTKIHSATTPRRRCLVYYSEPRC